MIALALTVIGMTLWVGRVEFAEILCAIAARLGRSK
jgi:hypothetical protein